MSLFTGARLAALLAITAFTVYYGVELASPIGPRGPAFLFWAWVTSLAWLVVAEQVLGVRLDLGDRWYRTRSWEGSGRLYERIGVRLFKKVVPNGDFWNALRRRFRPAHRLVRDRASLDRWARTTRGKEAAHAIHALLVLPALLLVLFLGWPDAFAWLLLFTVLLDLYPVMLQRYNRARLMRAGRSLTKVQSR